MKTFTENENQLDDINNNKEVIIENIEDETLLPNMVKKKNCVHVN